MTSGAIAAGLPALGYVGGDRPRDAVTLQAASAVGQTRLMRVYEAALAAHGLVSGQVLLAPLDFTIRQQYLHARATLGRLLDLGVVPIVNENDAIADDEIRFGDNDRLAALVAHLLAADLLVLLTDAPGLLTADPRLDSSASLIEEIVEVDHSLVAGQVLLAPLDFGVRAQYLHARGTLRRLLELGVVPVINENDAIADDEIRFGDNDRIAALVAHLVGADTLVLLTDIAGLLTADPRFDSSASLIEEILEVDHALEALAGGAGSARGSGGMASKVAAAKMAAWSGVRTVIASSTRAGVLADAVAGVPGVGTVVVPRAGRLSARKLWIGFAVRAAGVVRVDDGARRALTERAVSLLAAGVIGVDGRFEPGDAVEIAGPDGAVFGKGLVRIGSLPLATLAGRRTGDLPEGTPHEVVHRDDLVVLP